MPGRFSQNPLWTSKKTASRIVVTESEQHQNCRSIIMLGGITLMNTTSQNSRPRVVTLAVVFLAVVFAGGLALKILGAQSFDLRFYVEFVVTFLLEAVTGWFIFRGKNWARWVLIAMFVLGVAFTFPEFIQRAQHYSALRVGRYIIGVIADLIILFALFQPSASRWYLEEIHMPPNHALQRTRPSRSGCNPRVPWAGSLSLGR